MNQTIRTIFAFCILAWVFTCILGTIYVLGVANQPLAATPLVLLTFASFRHARWIMIWFSGPEERKILGKSLEIEPLARVLHQWIRGRGGRP